MTVIAAERIPRPVAAPRRFFDQGAIFAGWVGLGMGVIIAIAFELVIPVQTVVFLAAPLAGAIIGAYANVRAARWRPRTRVLANAAYAGVVTALGLAILYVLIRLLFIYADNGFPRFNQTEEFMGLNLGATCETGPACTYARYLEDGRGPELVAAGVTDASSFEAFVLHDELNGGLMLILFTVGGSLFGGALRALRSEPVAAPDASSEGSA